MDLFNLSSGQTRMRVDKSSNPLINNNDSGYNNDIDNDNSNNNIYSNPVEAPKSFFLGFFAIA